MSQTDAVSTPRISALRSSPERVVFTEDGNTNGWIASDTTIDVDTQL